VKQNLKLIGFLAAVAVFSIAIVAVFSPLRFGLAPDHHPERTAWEWSQTGFEGDRSSKWPAARNRYISVHPTCEACGSSVDLNVHHVKPFHVNPELELDPRNMITLCRTHHLEIGHACGNPPGRRNWSCANPDVRKEAAAMLARIRAGKRGS
jgi:hypothetical protein